MSALKLLLSVPNIDVNIVDNDGESALHWAVNRDNIEALKLLLNVQGIDVNNVDNNGWSALLKAVRENNNEALKLLLDVPSIHVNIVDSGGWSALHWTVKILLKHPSLTTLTLNQKDNLYGFTPVMAAVRWNKLEHLALLAADPRVDLDTTDEEGRSLEEAARWVFSYAGNSTLHSSQSVGGSHHNAYSWNFFCIFRCCYILLVCCVTFVNCF